MVAAALSVRPAPFLDAEVVAIGLPSLNGHAAIGGANPAETWEAEVEFACGHCGGRSLWLVAVNQEHVTVELAFVSQDPLL